MHQHIGLEMARNVVEGWERGREARALQWSRIGGWVKNVEGDAALTISTVDFEWRVNDGRISKRMDPGGLENKVMGNKQKRVG